MDNLCSLRKGSSNHQKTGQTYQGKLINMLHASFQWVKNFFFFLTFQSKWECHPHHEGCESKLAKAPITLWVTRVDSGDLAVCWSPLCLTFHEAVYFLREKLQREKSLHMNKGIQISCLSKAPKRAQTNLSFILSRARIFTESLKILGTLWVRPCFKKINVQLIIHTKNA